MLKNTSDEGPLPFRHRVAGATLCGSWRPILYTRTRVLLALSARRTIVISPSLSFLTTCAQSPSPPIIQGGGKLMSMIAFAFLQDCRFKKVRRDGSIATIGIGHMVD